MIATADWTPYCQSYMAAIWQHVSPLRLTCKLAQDVQVAEKSRQTEEYSRRYGDFFSRGRSEISESLLHYFYDVFHQNNKAR